MDNDFVTTYHPLLVLLKTFAIGKIAQNDIFLAAPLGVGDPGRSKDV